MVSVRVAGCGLPLGETTDGRGIDMKVEEWLFAAGMFFVIMAIMSWFGVFW
jgi:hypothetical protein